MRGNASENVVLTPGDIRGFPRITEITMNGEPISVTNLYLPGEFLPSLTDWEVLQAIGKPTHEFAKGLRLGRYLQEHSWLNRYAKPYLPVEVDQWKWTSAFGLLSNVRWAREPQSVTLSLRGICTDG